MSQPSSRIRGLALIGALRKMLSLTVAFVAVTVPEAGGHVEVRREAHCAIPRPSSGHAPDAKTAVTIAEAVLTPIYGEAQMTAERPFRAVLDKGVWTITGTLPCATGRTCLGGTAMVQLLREDGRVLCVEHGK